MKARRPLAARGTWLVPILLIVGLAAVLPAVLAGTIDPQGNLRDMLVGLVIEQQTGTADLGAAESVAVAIEDSTGAALAVTSMSRDELSLAMQEDQVAGAAVIPADFDDSIASLLPGADSATVPTVTILTNAGDGGLSNGLIVGNLTPVLHSAADALGDQLLHSDAATGLPAANIALMSQPFDIVSRPYEPPHRSSAGSPRSPCSDTSSTARARRLARVPPGARRDDGVRTDPCLQQAPARAATRPGRGDRA